MTDRPADVAPIPRPTLPPNVVNAARINVDVQIGPRGLQLVALRAGSLVLARSGWTMDVGAAWAALGAALSPMLLRVADRTVTEPNDDQEVYG